MSTFKYRAVMLDPARQMDAKSEFEFLLPWLSRWGYNVLHWHFADDEGCRIALPSHPELAGEGALSPQDMADLIRQANNLGITVIPELESFGHTRFITQHPKYRHLGTNPDRGYNALDIDNEQTYRLLEDLFRDLAALFPASIIHVGLDEVAIRSLSNYKDLPAEDLWEPFARHAVAVHQIVRKLGKRPAMWGDHLLAAPKSLAAIGKDVLIFDWHYEEDPPPGTMDRFLKEGFEVWGCPATMCWLARVVANAGDFANVRVFTANALQRRKQGVTGMVNTVWCPYRYLPGAMDYPIAWAGHVFSCTDEDPDFARRFAADFYGLKAADARLAADCFRGLHAAAPVSRYYEPMVTGQFGQWVFTREHVRLGRQLAAVCGSIAAQLKPLVRRARRHGQRLNDVLLSARVLQRVGQFAAARRKKRTLPSGKALVSDVEKAWTRTRVGNWRASDYHGQSAQKLLAALAHIT